MNAAQHIHAMRLLCAEFDSPEYRDAALRSLGEAAARSVAQHEQLRISEAGALDRLERYTAHCAAMAKGAELLRESVARSLARARDVDDPVGAGTR